MGYVYLAYAPADADEAGPLADLLRAAGWSVRFGSPGGADTSEITAREIDGARAVIVVWSTNSVGSDRVGAEARHAQARGNLIAVHLDAAPAPVEAAIAIDLGEASLAGEGKSGRAVLDAVNSMPAADARQTGVITSTSSLAAGSHQSRPGGSRLLIALASVTAAVTVIVGGVLIWSPTWGEKRPAPAGTSEISGNLAPANEVGQPDPHRSEPEQRRQWESLDRRDPNALRAFLATFASGPRADEARRLIAALDQSQWARVLSADDAAGTLAALEEYRASFADGLFLNEASEIEGRERTRIAHVQRLLAERGHNAGDSNGVLGPETIEAVQAYQRSAGLPPTGLVDAGLIAILEREVSTSSLAPSPTLRAGKSGPSGAKTPEAASPSEKPSGGQTSTMARPRSEPTPSTTSRPQIAQGVAGQTGNTPKNLSAFRDCYVCPEMQALPPGRFMMGDITGVGPKDERPARSVSISYRLAVGRFEVTFEEWDACVAEGDCRYRPVDAGQGRGSRPVVNLTPADISEYLAWLSRKTGKPYRLLSEAEWEYAARGGTETAWSSGNTSSLLCAFGNGADRTSRYDWRNQTCDDGHADVASVGLFKPNAFGLHDMIGNVWEWVADCWHDDYGGAPTDGSVWSRDCKGTDQVLRGGAYSVDIDKLRSSYRYHFQPRRMPFFGFRVARLMD